MTSFFSFTVEAGQGDWAAGEVRGWSRNRRLLVFRINLINHGLFYVFTRTIW